MQKNLNEIQLLQQRICALNDEQAFAALFRLCYKSLYRFAVQYVHTHEAAEEVVNDVFVKLWSYRASLQAIINLESYLFIAVKNQSLNYIKQYSHYHIAINEDDATAKLVSKHNPQQDVEWKELHFKLQQTIDQLPDQCRKVFRLIKEDGFKFKQVAKILNIAPRTVETQLYRAVKRIDAVLNEYLGKKKSNRNNLISIVIIVTGFFSLFFSL